MYVSREKNETCAAASGRSIATRSYDRSVTVPGEYPRRDLRARVVAENRTGV